MHLQTAQPAPPYNTKRVVPAISKNLSPSVPPDARNSHGAERQPVSQALKKAACTEPTLWV
jgi:hypothetical protein